jgi:hypothetical protein
MHCEFGHVLAYEVVATSVATCRERAQPTSNAHVSDICEHSIAYSPCQLQLTRMADSSRSTVQRAREQDNPKH